MLWPRPRSLSAMCPLRVRHVSASCPNFVRLMGPPCVRPCVCPCVCLGRVRHVCLPCVRPESASFASKLLHHVSAMSRPVSALSPPCVQPCVHFGCASKPCLPCVRLAFCPPCVPVGQGRGITRQISLKFFRANSAFTSAPCA